MGLWQSSSHSARLHGGPGAWRELVPTCVLLTLLEANGEGKEPLGICGVDVDHLDDKGTLYLTLETAIGMGREGRSPRWA